MRQAQKLFRQPPPSAKADTTNLEGMPAFGRSTRERFAQLVLTNTLGDSFYETQRDLLAETEQLHAAMIAEDENFYARALVYAREKGLLRAQAVYGLAAELAKAKDGALFERAFGGVVKTPNELLDFAAIVKAKRGGEGGRRIKRVAGNWLFDKMSEYWAIKYGADKPGSYSIADLFRSYHPHRVFGDYREKAAITWLLANAGSKRAIENLGNLEEATPQIAAVEGLKKAKTDAEKITLIRAGRLPHEVASRFAGTSGKVWAEIGRQMPIYALLRHLQTLERHGALDELRDVVISRFEGEESVRKSKIQPHRFLQAIPHVSKGWAQDALRAALDISVANVPDMPGDVAVALDISGSMGPHLQLCSFLAIALARRTADLQLMLFDTGIGTIPVSRRDSTATQASRIRTAGGTDITAPLKFLMHARRKVDTLIIITDEQQNAGSPFVDVAEQYRQRLAPNCRIVMINPAPYTRSGGLLQASPMNTYVYGVGEQAIRFAAMAAAGFGGTVAAIEQGDAFKTKGVGEENDDE